MKRKQFLASLLALVAAPVVAKQIIEEKPKPYFDVKRIQARIDFLRKYPVSEKEAFKDYGWMIPQGNGDYVHITHNGKTYWHSKSAKEAQEIAVKNFEIGVFKIK